MVLSHDALVLIIADSVLLVLATGAVVLRFGIRHQQRLSPQADDWTILAALIFSIAICSTGIYESSVGLVGVSLFEMSFARYEVYRKCMFAQILVGQNVYGFVKISVLLFYQRIFIQKRFRLVTSVMIIICVLYMIVSFFAVFFCARNISTFWTTPLELEGTEYVLDFGAIIVALAIVDIALDLIILALPIPVIQGLQINKKQKIHVAGIFLLGAFCFVSSIARLYYTIPLFSKKTNSTQLIGIGDKNEIWSHIEACAAVFTACLPTFAPLYRGIMNIPLIERTRSFFSPDNHSTESMENLKTQSRLNITLKSQPQHIQEV